MGSVSADGAKRVAIYGGSFNPPHVGHGMVAAWLGWTERVDEVWLVPTASHPFGKALLPFAQRVEMCEALAACVGSHVRVCTIEAELPFPSYTIDTLEALAERHPEHRFVPVIGADLLPDTPRWRRWEELQARFPPLVVGRAGYPPVPDAPVFPAISSTQIRALHAEGASIEALVPRRVRELLEGVRFNP